MHIEINYYTRRLILVRDSLIEWSYSSSNFHHSTPLYAHTYYLHVIIIATILDIHHKYAVLLIHKLLDNRQIIIAPSIVSGFSGVIIIDSIVTCNKHNHGV